MQKLSLNNNQTCQKKNLLTSLIWVGDGVNIDSGKIRKIIIFALPLIMFFWIGNKISFAYRTVTVVGDISVKAYPFIDNLGNAVTNPLPSLHPYDVLIGAIVAGIAKLVIEYKKNIRKNLQKTRNTVLLVGETKRILLLIMISKIKVIISF